MTASGESFGSARCASAKSKRKMTHEPSPERAIIVTKTTPNFRMTGTWTSLGSKPGSVGLLGSVGCITERFLHERIVERQKRLRAKLAEEHPEPDAADARGRRQVQPMDGETVWMEKRHELPEDLDEPHDDDEPGHEREPPAVALQVARQEHEERQEEVAEDESDRDRVPRTARVLEVPLDLLGQVSRPDDQELREREVRVHHDEREHELAEV